MWDSRRNTEWNVEWLTFADDVVLQGDSEEKLEKLVQEFAKLCSRWKLWGEMARKIEWMQV